ncbi:hypothetical protein MUK42_00019 [Musa troglodytarum]|uniref:Uncharacterized protein n=1 Tax=Musa troglodytarum TaxID=320322 RepID=A0A9E7FA20_9LILI|nr:hypothetical protein MUK42_00019 [Musa troglodytarum]
MARLLCGRTLAGASPPVATPLGLRGLCSRSERPQLIEVELQAEDFPPEIEVLGMRRLADVIHAIVVRRSAPYWLPFLPGSSYWVPPRNRHRSVAELVSRLANPMTAEEIMSFTTVRGWPSSAYFVEGASLQPVKKRQERTKAQSDDEES